MTPVLQRYDRGSVLGNTLSSWVNGLAYIQCVVIGLVGEVITVVVCILGADESSRQRSCYSIEH